MSTPNLVRCADCAHMREPPDPLIRAKVGDATRCNQEANRFSWFSPTRLRECGLYRAAEAMKAVSLPGALP